MPPAELIVHLTFIRQAAGPASATGDGSAAELFRFNVGDVEFAHTLPYIGKGDPHGRVFSSRISSPDMSEVDAAWLGSRDRRQDDTPARRHRLPVPGLVVAELPRTRRMIRTE